MSIWARLRSRLGAELPRAQPHTDPAAPAGVSPPTEPVGETRSFPFDAQLLASLEELAAREQRPPREVMTRLLDRALEERRRMDDNWARWRQLTPREQDVVALICLGYTSRQICLYLNIAPATVRTHSRNALEKFELATRRELRDMLASWDFSAWQPPG